MLLFHNQLILMYAITSFFVRQKHLSPTSYLFSAQTSTLPQYHTDPFFIFTHILGTYRSVQHVQIHSICPNSLEKNTRTLTISTHVKDLLKKLTIL